jgi:hypothetical protein
MSLVQIMKEDAERRAKAFNKIVTLLHAGGKPEWILISLEKLNKECNQKLEFELGEQEMSLSQAAQQLAADEAAGEMMGDTSDPQS